MPADAPVALSKPIVAAVRRYQRNLVTYERKQAAVEKEGWSDEVLRRERTVITARALDRALEHLEQLLIADAVTHPIGTGES